MLDFVIGIFSFVSKFFIDGVCVVAIAHATKTMSGATRVVSSWCDVIDECLIFCSFPSEGSCSKYIITLCKFYKLYIEF